MAGEVLGDCDDCCPTTSPGVSIESKAKYRQGSNNGGYSPYDGTSPGDIYFKESRTATGVESGSCGTDDCNLSSTSSTTYSYSESPAGSGYFGFTSTSSSSSTGDPSHCSMGNTCGPSFPWVTDSGTSRHYHCSATASFITDGVEGTCTRTDDGTASLSDGPHPWSDFVGWISAGGSWTDWAGTGTTSEQSSLSDKPHTEGDDSIRDYSIQDVQWRLSHNPSPTCYLKVWLQRRDTPDGGSDSVTALSPYTWTATGNPCADPNATIYGDVQTLSAPSANGTSQIEIVAYSYLPSYTPPMDGSANGFPPAPPSA